MQIRSSGKSISSIIGVLPEREALFDDEVENYDFPVNQTMRLKKIMGYDRHRLSKASTTVSDLALHGLQHMLSNDQIVRSEIGAIVTVTLCPDHLVPHTGGIIQSRIGLGHDVICIDIAQGCCGFLLGLIHSFMLLDHLGSKKVLLINGDVLSHKVSTKDRSDFPLIGDGASITVVENSGGDSSIYCEMHMDGSRGDAIKIPAGGMRMPCTPETAKIRDAGDGNKRSLDHLCMDGAGVFSFVQTEVPPMLERIFREVEPMESFDRFFFHQPNRFMLQKLAESVGIPEERLPMDLVEKYGNLSGASIPFVIAMNSREDVLSRRLRCCMSAFGSGLAWGTILMDIGPMANCEIITSEL